MIRIGFLSPSLLIAASIQILCQLFKVVYYSIRERRLQWHRFFHPAGMPSAHSAFVTALTVCIAAYNGIRSDLFALSFVFSVIIIYDTFRLRGAVQSHSRIILKLARGLPESERQRLPRYIGHTGAEIIAGVLIGGLWGLLFSRFLIPL